MKVLISDEEKLWKSFSDILIYVGLNPEDYKNRKKGSLRGTSPLYTEIRGFGEFIERITGDAESLWRTHGHETCLKSYEEYIDFLQGRTKVTFIRFKNFRRLQVAIPANVISKVTGIGRMPRSGKYINKETAQRLI